MKENKKAEYMENKIRTMLTSSLDDKTKLHQEIGNYGTDDKIQNSL